ncbi:MAG: M3 family oligoendopeptidase [Provencibacterium sp.]|nr:M3 family oligoendopeptidase [Provencibacterium sp.]
MKFTEMPYHRPDDEKMEQRYLQMAEEAPGCTGAKELLALLDEHEQLAQEYRTMESLAYIRHSVDTTDAFYEGEMSFFDERGPIFAEAQKAFKRALAGHPLRSELEKTTGPLLFKNIEIELRTSSEESVPLQQRDNEVCTAYEKLLASASISFRGGEYNLSEIQSFQTSPDRETRRAAWEATAGFFAANAEELDRMYDELVHNRDRQAKVLGYENYVRLGYDRMGRNCYGPEEVKRFREQVVREVVPAAARIKAAQAARLGIEKTMYYDNGNAFPDGNPKPAGGETEIIAAARGIYHRMGEETGRFFDYMEENSLFDLKSRKGKQTGGYCTSLPLYKSPFIFANFNGTAGDVAVLTHEGGHALQSFLARDMRFMEYADATMETCETHSMSMELFCARFAADFFGPDTQKFLRYQLEDALCFIPYGCMVDEFQETVYENPTLTPKERKGVWAKLEKKYRPWICFDGVPFFEDGGYQRQHHIYSAPLYYIDYCLAQTAALCFWSQSQQDWENAFSRYLRFTHAGGTKTFTELLAEAGLPSPFEEGGLRAVCRQVEKTLQSCKA